MKKILFLTMVLFLAFYSFCFAQSGTYLGNLNSNPFDPNSLSNSYGKGNPYNPNSNNSPASPYAVNPPKLYDSQGEYKGNLSANPYDPNSTSNPYGKYGSRYSPDSLNNPYGAGSPYKQDSPNNPYGKGWEIFGQ